MSLEAGIFGDQAFLAGQEACEAFEMDAFGAGQHAFHASA
jgi:hypothetical protein